MNLAILHYHLNHGGVTRVIENQLAALDAVLDSTRRLPVALLYGGRRQGFHEELAGRLERIELTFHEVPALDYDEHRGSGELGEELEAELATVGFAADETVLHVHNHSLGRNLRLPESLARLAADGFALLLQIHDFVEDLRPANYHRLREAGLAGELYPQASHIHYAVLNGRDEGILKAAGVPSERLHKLPNPVPTMNDLPAKDHARGELARLFQVYPHQRFVLYPVRGIRRKNIGEALLYAALAPAETVVGFTLPPLNPAEVPIYEGWKKLAAELKLPCRFALGAPPRPGEEGMSFRENLAAADQILTTSVAEGFGMVFLESWLAERPLAGRDLPEITRDFAGVGLRLDWLRPRLDVPVDWVGVQMFQRTILDAYRRTLEVYGHVVTGSNHEPEDLPGLLEKKIERGLVDFGDLNETLQQQVIHIACRSEADRRRLLDCNRGVDEALAVRGERASEAIEHNVPVIREHYGLDSSGRRLLQTYEQVIAGRRNQTPKPLARTEQILDYFLGFARFRPIRS